MFEFEGRMFARPQGMECGQCSPSRPFVVLPDDRFVGHGGSPLERQKQDSRVYRKTGTLSLIFRKNRRTFLC